MNLFDPKKDLIWRIVNAVLLVWSLISIVVFLNFTIVENLVPDSSMRNYNNYRGTLGSVISFVISAGALWYLNMNKKEKKAK